MYQLIIIVHVLLGLGVIGLVLMQQGKGADAGAAFAGGGSGSVFGAQGAASFLSRTTAILAALFFTTSLGLAVLSGHDNKPDDLMEQPEIEQPSEDVPLVGESKPSAESTPVISPVEKVPAAPEPVTDTPIENMPAAVINEPQQANEDVVPIDGNNTETSQMETTVSDDSTPVTQNDTATKNVEIPIDESTDTVTP